MNVDVKVPALSRLAGGRRRATWWRKFARPFGIAPPIFPRRVDWYRQNRAFKIDAAKRDLGYNPKVGLDEGLKRTYEWYKQEGYL